MNRSKQFGVGSVIIALSALLTGGTTLVGGQDGASEVFGLAGIVVGISLLVIGVGMYREWEGFSVVQ